MNDDDAATIVQSGPPPEGERPRAAAHRIAGYHLCRVIGRGGHGEVWEAIELKLERTVALKVHASSAPVTDRDRDGLWAEALVAARIGDPSIVRVFDVGYTIDDRPYYSMELVHGTDLGAIIADGPLAPRRAVGIAADVARAAASAHRHGVIHRDLKPRNVIIDEGGRARVCDFGIAYDEQRGVDPLAGFLAGSPAYMAPEQVLGRAVVPQTDIWAIGVLLYEMLTGQRPFVAASTEELLAQIVTFEPLPPSAHRDAIHGDLDAVIARCLAKAPEARVPSAQALFEMLAAITEGRRVDAPEDAGKKGYAPKISGSMPAVSARPRREGATKHVAWSWRLRSSPAALWPLVSNTDRFNKAVGLSPVDFRDEPSPDGGVVRTGEFRVLGMNVSWREYPFEWIRHKEHSVFRWYKTGPLLALWNKVTLLPLEDGGTELRHEIWLTPRGVVGQVAAFFEVDRKLGPAVDRFYRRLDEIVASGSNADPFEPPHEPTSEQRALVEAGCARLHAEGFAPRIAERLAMHLLSAPDGVVGTLRPYELADAWGTERGETLDAFVHAADAGLLVPSWDVVCPKCTVAHESFAHLAEIAMHGRCAACATAFERDLACSVELVFRPHSTIRPIEHATYCAGSPAKRPQVVVQQVLDPGEARTISVELPRGAYRVLGAKAKTSFELIASAIGFEGDGEITSDGERIDGGPSIVKAGTVRLTLKNRSAAEETIRIDVAGDRDDAVSAAAALTHPSFRFFFSSEVPAQDQQFRVSQLAFVFVGAVSLERIVDAHDEATACAELARLEAVVGEEARRHEGEFVPSPLATLIAGFPSAARAARAALSIRSRIAEMKLTTPIAIALHEGRCVVLTRADRPEYFGETLYRGEALLRCCPGGGVALSAAAASDHDVAVAVHESGQNVVIDKQQDGPYAGRRITLLLPE